MAVTVTFYKFSKRHNSTKVVDVPGLGVDCEICPPFTMEAPVLKLDTDLSGSGYNYCYVNIWDRYYFVESFGWREHFPVVTLTPDVCASHAALIKNSTQYILRSTTLGNNKVVDTFYPEKADVKCVRKTSPEIFKQSGSYMLGVAGSQGTLYYNLTWNQLKTVCGWMFGQPQDNLWDVLAIKSAEDFVKTFIDPYQYIVECYYVPFPVVGGDTTPIQLGYWTTGISAPAMRANSTCAFYTGSIDTPRNPYAEGKKAYLQSDVFSIYILTVPYCGSIQLPADIFDTVAGSYSDVSLDLRVDVKGDIACKVMVGNALIGILHGNCAVPVAISSKGASMLTAIGQAASVGAAAASNDIAGTIGAGSALISSMLPVVLTNGISGGSPLPDIMRHAELTCYFKDVVDHSSGAPGSAAHILHKLNAAGWHQCQDPQIEFAGLGFERDLILDYLKGGIWIE